MTAIDHDVEFKPVWPSQPVIDAAGTFALYPDGTYHMIQRHIEPEDDDGRTGEIDAPNDLIFDYSKRTDVNPYTLACKRYLSGG